MVSGIPKRLPSDSNVLTTPSLPMVPAMPKDEKGYSTKSLLIFRHNDERFIGERPSSYNDAVVTCRELFPSISDDEVVTFHTNELDICEGKLAKISAGCWKEALGSLRSITVMKEAKPRPCTSTDKEYLPIDQDSFNAPSTTTLSSSNSRVHLESFSDDSYDTDEEVPDELEETDHDDPKLIPLKIRLMGEGREISFNASSADKCGQTEALLAGYLGKNPVEHTLINNGEYVCSINESLIGAILEYRKTPVDTAPIIYFHAPKAVKTSVTLSLSRDWMLSGTYPVVPIKPRTASSLESVTWKVIVHPSGVLTDQSDGSTVWKMAWEAQKYSAPALPGTYPSLDCEQMNLDDLGFDPNTVSFNDDNTVILSPKSFSFYDYFDKVFTLFGVDTTAGNRFEGAWKNSLSKHKYVAVRFLPQDYYSKAARLDISPSPDVLTRIFVVFQGIKDADLKNWPTALEKGNSEDVSWCREMIGGEFDRASDDTLFRVLELGGMEVVSNV